MGFFRSLKRKIKNILALIGFGTVVFYAVHYVDLYFYVLTFWYALQQSELIPEGAYMDVIKFLAVGAVVALGIKGFARLIGWKRGLS